VSTAFRSTGNLAAAFKQAMTPQPAETNAGTPAPASTNVTSTPAPAEKVQPVKAKASVPDGWFPRYSNTGFIRYARCLKANGQPVTAYRVSAAKTPDQQAIVQSFKDQGVSGQFVVHNHTTGVTMGFDAWAEAYAFSCTMFSPQLARSVVTSIGGAKGLSSLSSRLGIEVSQRIAAIIADDEAGDEEGDGNEAAPEAEAADEPETQEVPA
jgi:hypothetical protein